MEACNGNKTEAARALGITKDRLKGILYLNPALRARWYNDETEAPDEIDGLNREPISADEQRLAKSYEDDSKKFREDVSKLPLPAKAVDIMVALQNFNRGRFKELLEVSNASMGMTIPILMIEMEKVGKRLDFVRDQIEQMGGEITEERMAAVEEEKGLARHLLDTTEMLRKIQGSAVATSEKVAMINYRINGGGKQKKAKPGFQTIDA